MPGSIAQVNNNPGNLRSGPGQIGTSNGFAVFPDVATGYAALDSQIDYNVSLGLNLDQFFAGEPGRLSGLRAIRGLRTTRLSTPPRSLECS